MTENALRQKAVEAIRGWLGAVPGSAKHTDILNTYNGHRPLARGYAIRPADAYCAATVSAAWLRAGAAEIAPLEVSVPKMVTLARKRGIWVERDGYVPRCGDAIVYDWQDSGAGDNTGYPDHVGLVESAAGGVITVIEGNMGAGHMVGRRTLAVDGKYIRGFICPDYAALAGPEPDGASLTALAREVIAGRWGNGADRKRRLTEAGYDAAAVQAEVNRLMKGETTYTVRRGDTLSAIARRFGTTVARLARDNAIADPDRIYAGQKLTVKR